MDITSTVHQTSASLIYKQTQKVGDLAAYSFWATTPFIVIGFFIALFTFDTPAGELIGYIFAAIVLVAILSIVLMGTCMSLLKKMRHL